MAETVNGRGVLGLAREVTGEIGIEEASRGTVNLVNDQNEQTVHDPRVYRALERIAAQQQEMCTLLRKLVEAVGRGR